MRGLGSAQRLNPVRASRPGGHPPWEPAEKPVSELPWMDAPGAGQSPLVPPRRSFPAAADGPPAGAGAGGLGASGLGAGGLGAGEAGRPLAAAGGPADPPPMTASGLVRRRPKSQSPFPELEGPPPGLKPSAGSGSGDEAEESRPVYSWNPSATTEAFPVVPPPGDSHPG